jgi:hypothetical protein
VRPRSRHQPAAAKRRAERSAAVHPVMGRAFPVVAIQRAVARAIQWAGAQALAIQRAGLRQAAARLPVATMLVALRRVLVPRAKAAKRPARC